MPTINFTDAELAAVAAAIRNVIESDRYPLAPRLDPLKSALGKLEQTPQVKSSPMVKAEKRASR